MGNFFKEFISLHLVISSLSWRAATFYNGLTRCPRQACQTEAAGGLLSVSTALQQKNLRLLEPQGEYSVVELSRPATTFLEVASCLLWATAALHFTPNTYANCCRPRATAHVDALCPSSGARFHTVSCVIAEVSLTMVDPWTWMSTNQKLNLPKHQKSRESSSRQLRHGALPLFPLSRAAGMAALGVALQRMRTATIASGAAKKSAGARRAAGTGVAGRDDNFFVSMH